MIYFDNASTTKPSEEVCDKIREMLYDNFANPSSLHRLGYNAENILNEDKKKIANILGVSENEIYFTSGGTESNNMAVLGVAEAYKRYGDTVVTTKTEHPSVAKPFEVLKERGFEVCYLDVDEKGYINVDELKEILENKKVILVSLMHVNNEIGTIQDIELISKMVKEMSPKTIFHTDGVQAFAKHRLKLNNVDLYSFSGHKIHAPKGIGGLFIKNGVRIKPIINGGQQQNAVRPGTENTAYISGLALAAETAYRNMDENYVNLSKVKKELMTIKNALENVYINGDEEKGSAYILSLAIGDVRGEVLMHALENRGIYVSTGSACSSKNKKHMSVVDYVNPKYAQNTIRISFCKYNTIEEAKEVKKVIIEETEKLRKYKRR